MKLIINIKNSVVKIIQNRKPKANPNKTVNIANQCCQTRPMTREEQKMFEFACRNG